MESTTKKIGIVFALGQLVSNRELDKTSMEHTSWLDGRAAAVAEISMDNSSDRMAGVDIHLYISLLWSFAVQSLLDMNDTP